MQAHVVQQRAHLQQFADEHHASGQVLVLVLVLVVDERGSFSAIDAHIFPCLVQTVLEDVD